MRPRRATGLVVALAATVAVSPSLAGEPATPAVDLATHESADDRWFDRVATYPVFHNRPAGDDRSTETVAEIAAASEDGATLVYADALAGRIGFLDITDPAAPRGLGTRAMRESGDADAEPTSVAVAGEYALVAVNTSANFTDPSGRLDVIRIADQEKVADFDLGGQPDAVSVGADQRYAAIAIENERDEDHTPEGGEEGDLPQLPAGFVQIVDLHGTDPQHWSLRKVDLTRPDGSALPALARAGIVEPTDPEPEWIAINRRNQALVTLQENNGVVVIDLRTGRIRSAFSTGTATVSGIDTVNDGVIDLSGQITDVPREPDSAAWIGDRAIATANEGDWRGGTRGWSIFDANSGRLLWDAGNSFEHLAVKHGLHNEGRSDRRGAEPEGLAVAEFDGVPYAFVAAERSNFVAVYDVSNPRRPEFRQLLPTTSGPEGVLPIPDRDLLIVTSEHDDSDTGIRSTVGIYRLGDGPPAIPHLVSGPNDRGQPIGWGGLSGLSPVPGEPDLLYAVQDKVYAPTRILTIDAGVSPAVIVDELVVTGDDGKPAGYDAEGIAARPGGGFWLAHEGATGPENALVELDAGGRTMRTIPLPDEVADGLGSQGLEGVTVTTDADGREQVWVAVQREVATDPEGIVRLGRYDLEEETWAWFGYRLESTDVDGDWIGLSELVAIGDGRLAVLERDKLSGPDARLKAIYTVEIPRTDPEPGTLPVLEKTLVRDLIDDLSSTNGWVQEKVEGMAIGDDGIVSIVTDNDGLQDATGETVFLRLGTAAEVFTP